MACPIPNSPCTLAVLLTFVLTSFVGNASAESGFSKPPAGELDNSYDGNIVYDAGESIMFKWTDDILNKDLLLWQAYPEADDNYERLLVSEGPNFRATVKQLDRAN